MLKFFKAVILLPIFAVLIDFAVSNRNCAELTLWPLPYKVETPVYILLITVFIVTTIVCALVSFFSSATLKKELKQLKKDLAKEKEETALLRERIDNLKQKGI